MEHLGYEVLGLKPWELYQLTIREITQLGKFKEQEDRSAWRRAAFISVHLINMFAKRKTTVDKLLGLDKPVKRVEPGKKKQELDYLDERVGG